MNKKVAIVAGEPFSINSEIIAKSWKKIKKQYKKNIFVIGNYSLIKKQFNILRIKIPTIKIDSLNNINSTKKLQIFDIPLKFKNPFKVSDKNNSRYVLKCIDKAHELAVGKKILGFINCPINKNIFSSKNFGVTEYLAKKNKLKNLAVMMIYNEKLSVIPITTHIPVKEISKKLNKKTIERKIKIVNNFYYKLLKRKPIVAVLGLNPHNSELRYNSEERKVIIPAIKKLKKDNYKIIGPFSSDTIFLKKKKYQYDVIVGMYHDQVLAPFKTIYGYDAINVTLGLKYIRISPDHGVAKDIVKKNRAETLSLIKAVKFILKN